MLLWLSREILIFQFIYMNLGVVPSSYQSWMIQELCLKIIQHLFSLHPLTAMTNQSRYLFTLVRYQKFLFSICMLVTIRYCPQVSVLEVQACNSKLIKSLYRSFSQQQRSSQADIVKELWTYAFHYWHVLEGCGGDSHPWCFHFKFKAPLELIYSDQT